MRNSPAIWALVLPIILSNITVPLIGAVDTAVMGHMETAAYLGAVAVGSLIFDYIYWGFGFLRLSTTGLTAQALGREDGEEVRALFARALILALLASALLWGAQSYIFQVSAYLIDASAEVEALAKTYFQVRIWSAPAALTNYILIGWMLACKDTKSVLIQQVATNIANVVLDLWFVMGLGFGVEGVAFATVLAQYCGLGIGLILMRRNLVKIEGAWRGEVIFVSEKFTKLISMNSDLFIRTVCLLSAFAWLTAQGAKMGDVVLAANAILLQFLMFASYGLDGFAHAVEVLCGHGVGKKDRPAFQGAVRATTKAAFLTAIGLSVCYFLFGNVLINLFSNLPAVLETAKQYLIWAAVLPVVAVGAFQMDGIYLGLTQTRMLRNMMVLSLALYIPLSLMLQSVWGNHGLWAAFTFFMGMRAITLGMTYTRVEQKVFA
ncbi:MATE family efflux transporter [Terasakiella brassicae]|uniref:MATE family efflux transporter n=1 Tax=Terasakiella brassicae TaxID=1634917 RepID=A0A917BX89_9PROT|nr:MATE family efflux transporter [Terasakiella brassicae]GGF61777.1 MATE family efflux transporter [Terasakiella brassicae]